MSLLFFGLITGAIIFIALAYLFIFSVQSSLADNRALFIKAFAFALICLLLNGMYFLEI